MDAVIKGLGELGICAIVVPPSQLPELRLSTREYRPITKDNLVTAALALSVGIEPGYAEQRARGYATRILNALHSFQGIAKNDAIFKQRRYTGWLPARELFKIVADESGISGPALEPLLDGGCIYGLPSVGAFLAKILGRALEQALITDDTRSTAE